ncbi:uncharacterized protein LOC107369714 [Tetranychus urticae]|uniref:Uncharacterized protein n=1 Tax=Tetranychus urticae TaxID=32264 RepID=T1L2X3_TETUR|nr:uncharacterized protein LOC107369714 [Tetranychus urticae]
MDDDEDCSRPSDEVYKLLYDEEDSDIDDGNFKRTRHTSSNDGDRDAPNERLKVNVTAAGKSDLSITRTIRFDDALLKRTITKPVKAVNSSGSPGFTSPVKPATSSTDSESVFQRLSFPEKNAIPQQTVSLSTNIQRPTIPKSSSTISLSEKTSSPSVKRILDVQRPSNSIKLRPSSDAINAPISRSNLDLQLPQVIVPPKSKPIFSEKNVDLDTFLRQLKSELIAHRSLDRLYNRSLFELSAMKKNPDFQQILKSVVEGVLFDPECQPNSDSVHKILKLLQNFDLDNTNTWTFLIDRSYTLITENTDAHYKRLSCFIEMTFNHLFLTKLKLLPCTALNLFKMAQVSPFNPAVKPRPRAPVSNLKSNLVSALQENQ